MIEAYNSTKARAVDGITLRSYNLDMLEQAMSEMRGEATPSTGAQGAAAAARTGSAGGKAIKRKLKVCAARAHLKAQLLISVSVHARRCSLTTICASAKNA